ncbi:MAG: nitrate- and nitrite sensing domain-containing protein, partial [Stackebrandtia sp.]
MSDSDKATTKGFALRRRLRLPRLSNMRIGSQLALILLIPLVALAGVASVRLVDSASEALNVGETAAVVELTETVSKVIRSMQDERSEAAVQIHAEELDLETEQLEISRFQEASRVADEHIETLADARAGFEGDAELQSLLDSADKPLTRLEDVRSAVRGDIAPHHLIVYNSAVSRLMRVLDRAVDLADNVELSQNLRAASLLTSADEYSERLRVLILSLADGEPLDAAYSPFMLFRVSREQAMAEYRRIGVDVNEAGAAIFDAGGLGAGDARPANTLESQVAKSRSHEGQEINHQELTAAYDARHDDTAVVVDETLSQTVDLARDIRDSVVRRVLVEAAVVVVTLVLGVLTALAVARSLAQRLRQLRDSARRVALEDLPTAVRRVDEQEGLGGLTPEEFADRTTPPLQTKGTNELAEVGGAFNEVHREAIRVAAQQALLRVHVGAMFVRLARRGHSLTGRLTATLDEAERDEQDPDRLQRLFRLDHLASLLGRANDSLLVLGGSSPAKVRTADEKLRDVLTAAQSHTEHYTRINISTVDEGVWVTAEVIDDVVQLLAELMDNATRYSKAPAEVIARFLTDLVVIQVRDFGIGIHPQRMARYNARLASRAPLDLEAMQAMGLTVVGHLAIRHGIAVQLRQAVGEGTIAEVTLPRGMLRFASNPDASRRGPAGIAAAPAHAPGPGRRSRGDAPLF